MKQYHTVIKIDGKLDKVWAELTNFKAYPTWNPIVGKLEGAMKAGNKISTFIVPLNNTFSPVLFSYKVNQEMVWKGVLGTAFLLEAHHYYRLNAISAKQTELQHGEYFTGFFSYFLSKKLISKMHAAFRQHNMLLKKRIEMNN